MLKAFRVKAEQRTNREFARQRRRLCNCERGRRTHHSATMNEVSNCGRATHHSATGSLTTRLLGMDAVPPYALVQFHPTLRWSSTIGKGDSGRGCDAFRSLISFASLGAMDTSNLLLRSVRYKKSLSCPPQLRGEESH